MGEQEIYKEFIQWLKQTWLIMPENDELYTLLGTHYTPEEAKFLIGFPFRRTTVEDLAQLKGLEESELLPILDKLAKAGKIWKDRKNGRTRYGLNEIMMGLYRTNYWRGSEDEHSRKLAPPANHYQMSGMMDAFGKADFKGNRVVPIAETVHPDSTVKPYEDMVKILDDFEYYSVSSCACRHKMALDPDHKPSKMPLEVCLHFDALGRYIVENDMGREITREDTEQILKKSAKAGLVHAINNYQEKPDTICNCDKQYCWQFENYHILEHNTSVNASEFVLATTSETCKGCGLCVKRCPMETLQMIDFAAADPEINKKGRVPQLNANACIGCGVCVVKCPTKSLILETKEETVEPPRTAGKWTMSYLENSKREKILERKK
ncbi:MAG: 4Fe-4S dicluster domain-containing protein [Proteobacteria bacterium]|nr:4Fe-4S dicluster domain-containing protein [Pseudomonadota bacterium]